jgi:hypothetical protein
MFIKEDRRGNNFNAEIFNTVTTFKFLEFI